MSALRPRPQPFEKLGICKAEYRRLRRTKIPATDFRSCEGLRMPAHEGGAAGTGAGVRKPPMEETAGGVARWRVRRCGDLSAVW